MKFKYILILMFIAALGFQLSRSTNLGKIFPIRQQMDYSMSKEVDGDLNIQAPIKYLILTGDNSSTEIQHNLVTAFDFSKTKYDIKKINAREPINLSSYSGVIITADDYNGMNSENFENLKKYVSDGKFIFIAYWSLNNPFNELSGINSIKGFKKLPGFQLSKEIYPGLDSNIKLDASYITNYSLDIDSPKDSKILAVSSDKTPLIWEKTYGKGKILYSNSDLFGSKISRGLFKQLVAYESKMDFSIVLNAKIFHIDDYPAPVPKIKSDIIEKEYGMNSDNFYHNIWIKDMYALAERNGILYTGFLIGDYNDKTDKNDLTTSISKTTSKELAITGEYDFRNGGEIGLHGYNHYPLCLSGEMNHFDDLGYKPWKDLDSMKESLVKVKNLYRDIYGDNFTVYSYVAPSNFIGTTGKKAVIETFPSINNFSGVFYEDFEPGLLTQEVGRDKDFKDIYSLPRFTAGYTVGDEERWQTYSALAVYGYSSHFVHPDDVFDPERSQNKTWEQLRDNFEKYVKEINTNFPYLKAMKQMELVQAYKNIENLEVDTELKDNNILVNVKKYSSPFYASLRINNEKSADKNSYQKIKNILGGSYEIMNETEEFTLYLIKVESPKIEIKLGE